MRALWLAGAALVVSVCGCGGADRPVPVSEAEVEAREVEPVQTDGAPSEDEAGASPADLTDPPSVELAERRVSAVVVREVVQQEPREAASSQLALARFSVVTASAPPFVLSPRRPISKPKVQARPTQSGPRLSPKLDDSFRDALLQRRRRPGEVVASYDLGDEAPKQSFGLAYRDDVQPNQLLISDYSRDRVEVFDVTSSGLAKAETVRLKKLDGLLDGPRGLAFRSVRGVPYLFVLTSNEEGDARITRLWRINLNSKQVVNTTLSELGQRKAFGLAVRGTTAYVSYDTSGYANPTTAVRRGVLRLRLSFPLPLAPDRKSVERSAGLDVSVLGHIPNSGRATPNSKYTRAPAFGLAVSEGDEGHVLWGTSYNKYVYAADGRSGRGLFVVDSPGAKKVYGLASGGGYLWAVDRPGNNKATVHKLAIAKGSVLPLEGGTRVVRHLRMIVKSKARRDASVAGVRHNYGRVHATSRRPSQGRDASTYTVTHDRPAQVRVKNYDPAGDASARQYYTEVAFTGGAAKDQLLTSTLDVDVWTRSRRQFVYPERCDGSSPPPSGYLADDDTVYRLSDSAAFNGFVSRVESDLVAEYGAQALSENPYWRARSVLEYIVEHHEYGNVRDSANGHYSYMPSSMKVALTGDRRTGNEKLTCSSSTFSLVATLRLLGVPARWVGTTKFRTAGKAKGVEVDDYDVNDNGFLDAGETSLDTSFHRWAEVWMGERYGWQRFDPTPSSSGPREHSQFELMNKCAAGVGTKDLVLTVGSGLQEPFYSRDRNQRYNSVATYDERGDWKTVTERRILWTNACFLSVGRTPSLVVRGSVRVTWTTSGRWDLDPGATVSVYAKDADGELTLLEAGRPWDAGAATVDTSGLPTGRLRFVVRKDGDSRTGAEGSRFRLVAPPRRASF